jgi:hypothetical protein
MGERAKGSGLANKTTSHCEKLFAAIINDDLAGIQINLGYLDSEYRSGKSGLNPKKIDKVLRGVVSSLNLNLENADSNPSDLGGDVKAFNKRKPIWFELKMQTKKASFRDLTQADYIREGTDFVRQLLQQNPGAMAELSDWTKGAIQASRKVEKGWDLSSLFLADLCLLKDIEHRHAVGVKTPKDLVDFAKSKYLVLLTKEGARWIRLCDLKLFKEVQASKKVNFRFNTANKTDISIQIRAADKKVHFTYHVGYTDTNVSGRHKLHALAVEVSDGTVIIPA